MSAIDQVAAGVINWAGFNSRTISLTNVAAGASIFVINCMTNFGAGLTSIGCSGVNDGSAYTNDGASVNPVNSAPLAVEIWRLHNASAGTHNIVLTSSQANSNNFGRIFAFSWTGLQNAAPDLAPLTNHANSSTPQTGTSGTMSQAGELIIAAMVLAATDPSPTFTSPANTGYTSLMNIQTTGNLPASADYQHVTATTGQSANWGTITGGNEQWSALLLAYKDVVAGSNPTITGVTQSGQSAGTIQAGAAGVTIAGTNFGSQTGSAAITLIDGQNSGLQSTCTPTSWGSSSITFTVSGGGNVRFGAATIKITTSGGLTATFGVTFVPPTGTNYQSLGALKALSYDQNNTPSRLTDSPDITNNEQLQFSVSGGTGTITITPDGNMSFPTTVTQITFSHHNGLQWSSPSHWDLRGPFPVFSGVIASQNGINGSSVSWNLASLFSESDSASSPLSYSSVGNPLPTGVTLNSSTGVASGTPSVTGTQNGIIIQATNADGSYVQSNPFSAVIAANNNVAFSGTVPDQANLTAGQNVALDVRPYFQNAATYSESGTLPDGLTFSGGILAGLLTGIGIAPGNSTAYPISVTGSNANPSSANSNTFTLTVYNPAIVAPAPPVVIPIVKSATLQLVERANSVIPPQQVIPYISTADTVTLREVCAMGANDPIGTSYRFFKIPSSALVDKLELANDANPARSLYNCGISLPTSQSLGSGGLPVIGADAIFFNAVSFDTARLSPVSVLQPALANQLPTVAARKLRVWQLLGYPSDPQQVYDVVVTVAAPGQAGGSIFLSMQYERGANNWYAP